MCRAMARLASLFSRRDAEESLDLLRRIEGEYHDPYVSHLRMMVHYQNGDFESARHVAEGLHSLAVKRGLWRLAFASESQRMISRPEITDVEQVTEDILRHYRAYGARLDRSGVDELSTRLFTAAIIHNRLDLLDRYVAELGEDAYSTMSEIGMLVALRTNPERLEAEWKETIPGQTIHGLGAMILGRNVAAPASLLSSITEAPLHLHQLRNLHIAAALAEHLEARGSDVAEIRSALDVHARQMLKWLDERGLTGLAQSLAERFTLVRSKGSKNARAALQTGLTATARPEAPEQRLMVVGGFRHRNGDGPDVPITGRRMQAIAGALVADALLGGALERRELVELATGEEYSQGARKVLNNGILRLRGLLGREAITTDADGLPRLNTAAVEVDILVQKERCETAVNALRNGLLAQATEGLESALSIAARGVPFPTLYDSLYDRLRDDIESELRGALLRVARALLDAETPEAALRLLQLGARAMTGDEEIAEFHREVLKRQYASARAELDRRRSAEEERSEK